MKQRIKITTLHAMLNVRFMRKDALDTQAKEKIFSHAE